MQPLIYAQPYYPILKLRDFQYRLSKFDLHKMIQLEHLLKTLSPQHPYLYNQYAWINYQNLYLPLMCMQLLLLYHDWKDEYSHYYIFHMLFQMRSYHPEHDPDLCIKLIYLLHLCLPQMLLRIHLE